MRIIKKGIHKGDQGFTLVELLITLGIISVGILWFYLTTVFVIRSNAHNKRMTTATAYAQKLLEEVKGTSTVGFTKKLYIKDKITYIGSRTVSFGNGTATSGFYQTDISVSWAEPGGTKTVEAISFHVP